MTPVAGKKKINLALQGGGAHGAFTWGVIDAILEDGRVEIEGLSGTSAGSMNAVIFAYGMLKGPEGARKALHDFWKEVSDAGRAYSPAQQLPLEKLLFGHRLEYSIANHWFKMMVHSFSPYQLNPLNLNPLKAIVLKSVDFKELHEKSQTKLWLTATNVRTGRARVFATDELSADVVMASACMPNLFQAVKIDGEYYWDGGFMGNPVLYPLIYDTESPDIVIVHINPIERADIPMTSEEISNRVHEISFNTALIKELRAVYFVHNLMEKGWIKDEYRDQMKNVLIHSIRSDKALEDQSIASKVSADWGFLKMLRDRGRACAQEWLTENFAHLNERSSVDFAKEFL